MLLISTALPHQSLLPLLGSTQLTVRGKVLLLIYPNIKLSLVLGIVFPLL